MPRLTNLLIAFAAYTTLIALSLPNAHGATTRDYRVWPFSQLSPWNHPIGSNAVYAPLPTSLASWPAGVNPGQWTASVAIASATDPTATLFYEWGHIWEFLDGGGKNCGNSREDELYLIAFSSPKLPALGNGWSNTDPLHDDVSVLPSDYHKANVDYQPTLRLPAGSCGSPDTDGIIVVFQPNGWIVEAYDAIVTSDNKLICAMASWIDAKGDGTGWWNGRRASMLPWAAGLIRKGEIAAGRIPHALAVTMPKETLLRKAVWPAYAFDRNANYSGSIPMGTLMAIPATVNITKLGLSSKGLVVARAAQDYGVYVTDRGGEGMTFSVELGNYEANEVSWNDYQIIKNNLKQVTNNTASTPGGGGTLRAPLAPPFSDALVQSPTGLKEVIAAQ